jgi:integrase
MKGSDARSIALASARYRYGDGRRTARLYRFVSGRKAGRYCLDYFVPPSRTKTGRMRPEFEAESDEAALRVFRKAVEHDIPAEIDALLAPSDTLESGDPTLADLCRWYRTVVQTARGNAQCTKDQNKEIFKRFVDWMAAKGVQTACDLQARAHLVDEYAALLLETKKPGTVKKELVKVKAVFAAAVARRRIPAPPILVWPVPKQKQPLYDDLMSPKDFQRLIEHLKSGTRNANGVGERGRSQIYGIVRFMALQACRPVDACNLLWSNLHRDDPSGPYAVIRQQKTGHPVAMALSREALELIREEEARGIKSPYVFAGRDGKHVTVGTVYHALLWHCKKLKLPRIHPKKFRQFGVSALIAAGADELYVRSVTGHESASVRNYKRKVASRSYDLAETLAAALKPVENEGGAKPGE